MIMSNIQGNDMIWDSLSGEEEITINLIITFPLLLIPSFSSC